MGLQKSIELENTGHENQYHRIDKNSLVINSVNLGGMVRVFSYKDHAARVADKNYSYKKIYQIPIGTMTAEFVGSMNPYQAAYKFLRTLPAFDGAADLV